MPIEAYLQRLPLWVAFIATLVIVFVSIEIGFRAGRHVRNRREEVEQAPIGAIVAATLGLLAFLLAFSFGYAANRFDASKALILKEANAIGTTELRARMFAEPHHSIIRNALTEYVDNRVINRKNRSAQYIISRINRSEALQARLWQQAVILGDQYPESEMVSLFVDSLNQMIDIHTERVTVGIWSRIPPFLLLGLLLVTVLSMTALGYHAGLTRQRNFLSMFLLALAFSTVIYLIADLDRPGAGFIKANQQPLITLRDELKAQQTSLSPKPEK